MKLIKHQLGGYISKDGSIRVQRRYPSLSANRMFWATEVKGQQTRYFKTMKEVEEYISYR